MNLLVIPSWYPSLESPLNGVFVREQAEAIAELSPETRVMVSRWGGESLSLRNPRASVDGIRRYIRQSADQVSEKNGVISLFNPLLSWSRLVPGGGVQQLVRVNRKNLLLAQSRLGKIDLIHAHVGFPGGYIAAELSREFSVPYVLTEHMSPFPFQSLLRRGELQREVREAYANARSTIAVSPSLAKQMVRHGLREPVIVPNLVDERLFSPGASSQKKLIFFTLCGLVEQKGIDHLLQAIAIWRPPLEQAEFWIGGDGPERSSYQNLARDLRIADRIKWLGNVERCNAPAMFKESSVFILPSRHETFGIVYAEALACGKPVIATRCGGPEFIVNKTNGILVDVGDVKSLADSMQWLAGHLDRYDVGDIRKDFMNRFSRQAVVRQLEDIYFSIAGRG